MFFRIEGFGLIVLEVFIVGLLIFVGVNLGFVEVMKKIEKFGVVFLCIVEFEDVKVWVIVIWVVKDMDRRCRLNDVIILKVNFEKIFNWLL